MTFDVGYTLGGIYEITKVLSEAGGMSSGRYLVKDKGYTYFAKVFDIFDPSFKQNGFKQEDLDAVIAQYSNEYKVLETVRCKGIPSVIKHFEEGCFNVVVSEYISGKNLEDMLTERQKSSGKTVVLSQDEVIDYTLELCNILEYLHTPNQKENRKAIVNRDIKPANIILGDNGLIYLVDFGTAKIRSIVSAQQKTVCTTAFGSPGYAAPEQHDAEIAEPTMDIYSLGATMYRLLSGGLPMSADIRVARFLSNQEHELCSPNISSDLEEVIHKTTALMVKDRYQNISEVRTQLQKIKAQAKQGVFAQPKRPATQSSSSPAAAHASSPAKTAPQKYNIIIPSGNPWPADAEFFNEPSGNPYNTYADGLVKFDKVCACDLQPKIQIVKSGIFGLNRQVLDVNVPLSVEETYYAMLMQPDLFNSGRFTRSFIVYPENDDSRFKVVLESDIFLKYLFEHPQHGSAGILLSDLGIDYDDFKEPEIYRKDATYNARLPKQKAMTNSVLLSATNNNISLIETMWDASLNDYNAKNSSSPISETLGVWLLNNSRGPAQSRALAVGSSSWNYSDLNGSNFLSSNARFLRVARKKFP